MVENDLLLNSFSCVHLLLFILTEVYMEMKCFSESMYVFLWQTKVIKKIQMIKKKGEFYVQRKFH